MNLSIPSGTPQPLPPRTMPQPSSAALLARSLTPQPITPAAFAPFGQVIFASPDGAVFGPDDAQLYLSEGIPRFYIMKLPHRGRKFQRITRHQHCTQCLGAIANQPWLMAVAPPSEADAPDPGQLRAFAIPGDCFIKLHLGTWHAGPYFDAPEVSFYNLELSDTNVTDHETCDLAASYGWTFEIV